MKSLFDPLQSAGFLAARRVFYGWQADIGALVRYLVDQSTNPDLQPGMKRPGWESDPPRLRPWFSTGKGRSTVCFWGNGLHSFWFCGPLPSGQESQAGPTEKRPQVRARTGGTMSPLGTLGFEADDGRGPPPRTCSQLTQVKCGGGLCQWLTGRWTTSSVTLIWFNSYADTGWERVRCSIGGEKRMELPVRRLLIWSHSLRILSLNNIDR